MRTLLAPVIGFTLACGGARPPDAAAPEPTAPARGPLDAPTALDAVLAGDHAGLLLADSITVRLYDYEVGDGWCARNLSVLFSDVAAADARVHLDWMHAHADGFTVTQRDLTKACAVEQGDCEHLLCVEVSDGRVSALERDAPYD